MERQASVCVLQMHGFIFLGCVCDFMASTGLFLNEDTVSCSRGKPAGINTSATVSAPVQERWNPMFLEVCASE